LNFIWAQQGARNKMTLEDKFSEEHMLAYSEACVNLATDLTDVKKKKFSFDTLVIPSRGAVPFFLGMAYAMKKLIPLGDDFKETYESIAIQPMLEPLMPKDSGISTNIHKKPLRILMIPFTADLNIPKFDSEQSNEEYTEKTRDYWARVTAAFFREPSLRMKNPYFKTFTEIVLRDIENRSRTAEIYEEFPRVKRFAMIDTVISGRASNDILGAFDDIALEEYNSGGSPCSDVKPFAFLIVDANGEKLEKHRGFKAYLQNRTDRGMAKLYPIPSIVSEDKNSALLGVSATVYPSLMKASKGIEYHEKEFFVGAGSWHVNPKSRQFVPFLGFMELIYSGIDVAMAQYELQHESFDRAFEAFSDKRINFVNTSIRENTLDLDEISAASDVNLMGLNRGASPIYETSSHVLHVPINPSQTRNLCIKICNYDYVRCKTQGSASDSSDSAKLKGKKRGYLSRFLHRNGSNQS